MNCQKAKWLFQLRYQTFAETSKFISQLKMLLVMLMSFESNYFSYKRFLASSVTPTDIFLLDRKERWEILVITFDKRGEEEAETVKMVENCWDGIVKSSFAHTRRDHTGDWVSSGKKVFYLLLFRMAIIEKYSRLKTLDCSIFC